MVAQISSSLGAMGSLPDKLRSLLASPDYQLPQQQKEGSELMDHLKEIESFLVKLSGAESPNMMVKIWMNQVRDLSYDIEDYIDRKMHSYSNTIEKSPSAEGNEAPSEPEEFSSFVNTIEETSSDGDEPPSELEVFSSLVKQASDACKRYKRYDLKRWASSRAGFAVDRKHKIPNMDMEKGYTDLIGIDDYRAKLIDRLNSDAQQQLKVVSILGPRGVGKTALAQQVYRQTRGRFEYSAFVRASMVPDTRRLLRCIISQVMVHQRPPLADTVQDLIDKHRKHLHDKRYLIVIDGLWQTTSWDIINSAFPHGTHSSRILVTTEIDEVALECCDHKSHGIIKMGPLSRDNSKLLFFSRVFDSRHECPEQLKDVSEEVIRGCYDIPLAIISIASIFESQRKNFMLWKLLKDHLASSMKNNLTSEDNLREIVCFSYNNLSHHLKTCLLYLTMYPEGYTFMKIDLLKQWSAEGFITIVPEKGNNEAAKELSENEVAKCYFDELVYRGFIQPNHVNYSDEVMFYTLHSMVYEVIKSKSIEENFTTEIDYSDTLMELTAKVRRLSLSFSNAKYATKLEGITLSSVRSLMFYGLVECLPSITEFEVLRVLILELWGYPEVLDLSGIDRLFQLRQLKVTTDIIVKLPTKMSGLQYLETLEIYARVTTSPSNIIHLPKLLHLHIQGPHELTIITGEEEPDKSVAESAFKDAIIKHSEPLAVNVRRVDWVDEEISPVFELPAGSYAQMAGVVLLAVSKIGCVLVEAARPVITKLFERVTYLKKLPANVKEIGNELNMMGRVIKQISTPSLTNELVKSWIAEVRELAHHVEDVMDKFSYHTLKLEEENSVRKLFFKTRYVAVFSEIADEITQIEKKIENLVKMKDWLLQFSRLTPNPLADIERKWSHDCPLDVVQDDLVGIGENRRVLTEWLNSEQHSNVITVYGMGGLGKTTLVANVFEREKNNFNIQAWIVMSQTYDVVELLRKLYRKIVYPEQAQLEDLDAHNLKGKIKERLKHRKCLIVLDDVWDQEAWTHIRDAFYNLQASRLIITTRTVQVANLAHPTRRFKLKPLEHNDAFALFCRKAFHNSIGYKCPHGLGKLAHDIVDRCQGLPLAIVSMGGLLSSLPPTNHVWNETYKQFRDQLTDNHHVRAILNLSYNDLPGDLRNCFLYCSLFPEGHQFLRESLVWLWVAEGFALKKEQCTPEEVADIYLRELIQRNMLEVVEHDELGRVSTCKMHDLVRDLAISVAREEKFVSANSFDTMVTMGRDVRRLSSCGWKDKISPKVKFPLLRTLVAIGIIASGPKLLSPILSESSYLTVLELQDSEITEVPASIGNLFNLRYIGLRRTRVKSLPESIGRLSNLHTLDIKQTKIEKLPQGIVKVKKLRHLLADRYADEKQSEFRYFIGVQAPKDLAKMEELQTLETVEANKDLAAQLMKLMQLQSLWIDNISAVDSANLFATLSNMPLLSSLLLSASDENEALHLEALKPASEILHRLIIRGCWAENTLQCPIFYDHGINLKYLAISWCRLQDDPLLLLATHVPNLTYLSLNRVSSANTLVISEGRFPQLKTLVLKRMPNVNNVEIGVGALRQIEGLYFASLMKLDKVPEGIESLQTLKKLWLLDLHKDFRAQWDRKGMSQKMQYVPELRI